MEDMKPDEVITLEIKIEELERLNDFLKEQLRKYQKTMNDLLMPTKLCKHTWEPINIGSYDKEHTIGVGIWCAEKGCKENIFNYIMQLEYRIDRVVEVMCDADSLKKE
jgi:hypothetical protein